MATLADPGTGLGSRGRKGLPRRGYTDLAWGFNPRNRPPTASRPDEGAPDRSSLKND
jgi:hypothetical protein